MTPTNRTWAYTSIQNVFTMGSEYKKYRVPSDGSRTYDSIIITIAFNLLTTFSTSLGT